MKAKDLPILGISMGDPAGIGPEVVVKAVLDDRVQEACCPLVVGDAQWLDRTLQGCRLPGEVRVVDGVDAIQPGRKGIWVLDLGNVPEGLSLGKVQGAAGQAALEYVTKAVELALQGQTDGIVTAPLNKAAVNAAGHQGFTGHTEYIAQLTGAPEVAMLLALDSLYISHVTTHAALREVPDLVTPQRLQRVLELTADMARTLGPTHHPIAVAGLNPHSGEEGLFGDEEVKVIVPVIEAARERGMKVVGPLPPDTVFLRAHRGEFSFVVAMYHDQGHIPAKLLGFETGVNVTLGLPIVRTSVDHGTAFDIAGTGVADPASMIAAILLGARLARGLDKNVGI